MPNINLKNIIAMMITLIIAINFKYYINISLCSYNRPFIHTQGSITAKAFGYYMYEDDNIKISIESLQSDLYPGDSLTIKVRIEVKTDVYFHFLSLEIYGVKISDNTYVWKEIEYLMILDDIKLSSGVVRTEDYIITIPYNILPGMIYAIVSGYYEKIYEILPGTQVGVRIYDDIVLTYIRNKDYEELIDKFNLLDSEYNTLRKNYKSLEAEFNKLKNEYNNLSRLYNDLQTKYETLLNKYNKITMENNNLISELNNYKNIIYALIAILIIFVIITIFLFAKIRVK